MPMLTYKQPRDIKRSFVSFVNKIFKLNTQWVNEKVEVISLTGDNSPEAFEQYPWDNENYPIVVLFSDGSTDDRWAIDERIKDFRETMQVGSVPRDFVTLGVSTIAAGIEPKLSDLSLKSVELLVKNIGPYEEPIIVKIYSATGDLPNAIIASGSIAGKATTGIEWLQTQILPITTLAKDTKYFIGAQALSGSYYWMVDNDVRAGVTPYVRHVSGSIGSFTGISSNTPMVRAHGPAVRRLGGGLNSTIRMFIESKDLSTTQKITDLLFVYMHLTKHANAKRRSKLTDPNITAMQLDFVSDLSDEGIYIIDVNKGAETVRTRGNDRLFSVDLSLTCYSSWSEDFVLPVLEEIDISPDIESIVTIVKNNFEITRT